MKIKFYGNTCFSIGDSSLTLITDPHEKISSLKANAVTVSQKDPSHNNVSAIQGDPKILDWPGEYEVSGINIQGIASFHNAKEDKEQKENTIFCFSLNGVSFCHLGCIGTKPTPEQLEDIGDVDVLFVPVGGKEAIDAKKAKEVIEQIEPRVIIPMAYCVEDDKCGLGPLSPFLQEMGAQTIVPIDEFDFKRSDLPEDSSKVVILNKQK
jgi:L-ascorbate metabolism protein UlaG (beta-lactamase superfamily)